MSALGSLVVKLALNHAEYTQGLSKTDQAALKFAQNSQRQFDRAERAAKQAFKSMALGAAGVVASLVGVSQGFGKIKGIIDFQDQLAKLAQSTGNSIEFLAGLDFAATQSGTSLERASTGVRVLSRVISEAGDESTKTGRILNALGLDLDELKRLSPEEQFFKLADGLKDIGENDRAVAVASLLGSEMASLVPLLSGGSDRLRDLVEQGQKYNPVTAESAARAEVFNDNLDRLSRSSSGGSDRLRDLVEQGQKYNPVTAESAARAEVFNDNLDRLSRSSGLLAQELTIGLVASLSEVTAEMAEAAEQGGILQGVLVGLGSLAKTVGLASLGPIGALIANRSQIEDVNTGISQTAEDIKEVTKQSDKASPSVKTFAQTLADIDKKFTKTSRSAKTLTKAEVEQDREAESLKRDIEKLTRAYDPLIERNERLARLLKKREAGLSESIFEAEATKAINDYIDATSGVIAKTEDIVDVTRSTTSEVDQLWIQSGRNIQSTLADSIFNFFDNGLKGMLKNVISTVGRIGSEFAALSVARGVGLGTLFAGGAAGASASAGGIDAFSLASTGINAASLLNSGFGATSLIGGGLSRAGTFFGSGSLTAFGEAFAGDAIAGFAGAAGGIGASLGAAAGPAIVLFAADQIGRLLAGDKSTGTFVDKVPVIGGFAGALFGRGPSKFRQQFLGGNVSEEGFQDGFVTDVFRRKGGLLRGNSHTQQDAANADEILSLFDDSIKAFFGSTRALAENLDLDARALDDLTLNVAIQSEKKKVISQEQISAEITRLSDAIAGSVLPNISDLTRGNETYATTLSRIGSELDSLSNIMLLLGRSTEQARTELLGLSIAERTQLTDKLGGVENANASFDSFFNNFLSPQDQLEILSDKLLTELAAVDINRIVSPEEVADAFLSGTLSVDHIAAALNPAMQALILQVDALKTSVEGATPSVEGATPSVEDLAESQLQGVDNAFIALQASADSERNKLTAQYNESVKEVNQSIGTLTALSGALKSSIETINPLDLDQARNNLRGAIAQASSGNIVDLNSVRTSLSVLSKNDTRAFRTREEFIRSQEENTSLLDQLGGITDDQLSAQERSLEVLQIGFDGELARLDSMVEGAQQQIDLLQGIHDSIQSSGVGGSLADFNTLSVAAGGSAIAGPGGSLPFNGNRNITGALIQDFLSVNDNPFDIYNAARDNNVSGLQLAANSPFTIEQINQFADDNGLQRLRVGTNFIPRDMPAFLHQGEEVKPKAFVDGERAERKELIGLMKKVLTATEVSTVSNNKVKKTLDKWEKVGMPKERAA